MRQLQGVQGAYNQPQQQAPMTADRLKRFGEKWVNSMLQELRYSEAEVKERWHRIASEGK